MKTAIIAEFEDAWIINGRIFKGGDIMGDPIPGSAEPDTRDKDQLYKRQPQSESKEKG